MKQRKIVKRFFAGALAFALTLSGIGGVKIVQGATTTDYKHTMASLGAGYTIKEGDTNIAFSKSDTWWKHSLTGKVSGYDHSTGDTQQRALTQVFCADVGKKASNVGSQYYKPTAASPYVSDNFGTSEGASARHSLMLWYYQKLFSATKPSNPNKLYKFVQAVIWQIEKTKADDVWNATKFRNAYNRLRKIFEYGEGLCEYSTVFETDWKKKGYKIKEFWFSHTDGSNYQRLLWIDYTKSGTTNEDLVNDLHLHKEITLKQNLQIKKTNGSSGTLAGAKFNVKIIPFINGKVVNNDLDTIVESANGKSIPSYSELVTKGFEVTTDKNGLIKIPSMYSFASASVGYSNSGITQSEILCIIGSNGTTTFSPLFEQVNNFYVKYVITEVTPPANYGFTDKATVTVDGSSKEVSFSSNTDGSKSITITSNPKMTSNNGNYTISSGWSYYIPRINENDEGDKIYGTLSSFGNSNLSGNYNTIGVSATVPNKLKKYPLEFTKTISNTSDGKAQGEATLEGAEYQVYTQQTKTDSNIATVYFKDGTSEKSQGFITDANGKASYKGSKVPYFLAGEKHNYYLTEIKAPVGTKLNETYITFKCDTADTNNNLTWYADSDTWNTEFAETCPFKTLSTSTKKLTNSEIFNHFTLYKQASTNVVPNLAPNTTTKYVSEKEIGAEFDVWLASKNIADCTDNEKDHLVTDENGLATTKNLPYGTYLVKQTKAGYIESYPDMELKLNPDVMTVVIDSDTNKNTVNGIGKKTMTNRPFEAYLKIVKKNLATGKTVLKNNKFGFVIKKVDKKTGDEIAYTTKDTAGNVIGSEENPFMINEEGYLFLGASPLLSGTYRIYEVKAGTGFKKGYAKSTNGEEYLEIVVNSQNVSDQDSYTEQVGNTTRTVTVVRGEFYDIPQKAKFTLKKLSQNLVGFDKDDAKKFIYQDLDQEGAEFTVYAKEDISTQDGDDDTWFKKGDKVAVIVSQKSVTFEKNCGGLCSYEQDNDKNFTLTLPCGEYYVKETKALHGYTYSEDNIWNLKFEPDESGNPYVSNSSTDTYDNGELKVKNDTITVQNDFAKVKVKITKYDKDSKENVTSGAIAEFIATGSSVTEVSASETAIEEDATPIQFAKFGLYANSDIYNSQGVLICPKDTLITELVTDEKGVAQLDSSIRLPLADKEETDTSNKGLYYVKEIDCPDGYYLNNEKFDFTANYKNAETKTIKVNQVVTDKPTDVIISKVSATNSKEISGCKLAILDKNNKTIVSWVSGDEKSIEFAKDLPVEYQNLRAIMNTDGNINVKGLLQDEEYTLKEIRSADGFVTADNIIFKISRKTNEVTKDDGSKELIEEDASVVSIKNGEVWETHADEKVLMIDEITRVEISKTDITGSDEIEGCELEITDENGKVIEKWTSGKEKHIILNKLIVGKKYKLKEVRSKAGYTIADTIEFVVRDTAEMQKVHMIDELTNVEFRKLDADNTEKLLGGAKVTVKDEDGNVVTTFETVEGEAKSFIGVLEVGKKYTFIETHAPDGYKIAKAKELTVKNTGDKQIVEMFDEQSPSIKRGGNGTEQGVPDTNQNALAFIIGILIGAFGVTLIEIYRKKRKNKKDKESNSEE